MLVFAASNADEYSRWGRYDEDGPMVLAPVGCEIEYVEPEEEAKAKVEQSLQEVKSAARQYSPASTDFGATLNQGREYLSAESQKFTMEKSGIEVAVHGPPSVEIDEQAFEEVFHSALTLDKEYTHPEVRQLIDCYRHNIIDAKKYAGTAYHIYIAEAPGYCIKGMRFQPTNLVESCDATGATPPEFEIGVVGFNLFSHHMMMLSTKELDGADKRITKTLLHESIHAYMSLMDQPLRLDPDERLAKHVESVVVEFKYPNGLPSAIKYTG